MKHIHTYIHLSVQCSSQEMAEILTAFVADYPFETFNTTENDQGVLLDAYIRSEEWSACREETLAIVADYGTLSVEEEVADENWNERWERESFEPVAIGNEMVIRSAYHAAPANPDTLDIVISPSMSFGSGYHQTTRMMCRLIYDLKATGRILDVGCGTGVLTIVALKCGAAEADAVDIDAWSAESAERAAELNGLEHRMRVITGTVEAIEGHRYDAIFANINRNIILYDIERYAAALADGGHLLVSGFLNEDVAIILEAAERHNLSRVRTLDDEGWVAMELVKR